MEEVENFKRQSRQVLKNICDLQDEILKYKNGADSFNEAVEVLAKITKKQEDSVKKVDEYIAGLYSLKTEGYIEVVSESNKKISDLNLHIAKLENVVDRVDVLLKNIDDLEAKTDKMLKKIDDIGRRVGAMEDGYIILAKKAESLAQRASKL